MIMFQSNYMVVSGGLVVDLLMENNYKLLNSQVLYEKATGLLAVFEKLIKHL